MGSFVARELATANPGSCIDLGRVEDRTPRRSLAGYSRRSAL